MRPPDSLYPYGTLPEDTSFRRRARQILLQGRTLHAAMGVLKACLP